MACPAFCPASCPGMRTTGPANHDATQAAHQRWQCFVKPGYCWEHSTQALPSGPHFVQMS